MRTQSCVWDQFREDMSGGIMRRYRKVRSFEVRDHQEDMDNSGVSEIIMEEVICNTAIEWLLQRSNTCIYVRASKDFANNQVWYILLLNLEL